MQVAVKHLKPKFFDNGRSDAADFVAEGKLLSSLSHPAIVSVIGMGFDVSASGQRVNKNSAFICMEPCLRGSLRDVIRDQMQHFSKAHRRTACRPAACRPAPPPDHRHAVPKSWRPGHGHGSVYPLVSQNWRTRV